MNKSIFSIILFMIAAMNMSCKHEDTFWWEADISAPKYYPVSGSKVNFGNAGNSSGTNFDNGWGFAYGAIVSDKFKKVPTEVHIEYYSAAENLKFEGTVKLPSDTILRLFRKYCKDREHDEGHLIVGMAPGGWIRVWAHFSAMENSYYDNIEVAKAQLKAYEDSTISKEFLLKKNPYWDNYKTYWNHFGVPYEQWAENEKRYKLFLNLSGPNPEYEIGSQFNSKDGTLYFGAWRDDPEMIAKLPADLIISWWKKNDSTTYDTHILMPKSLVKVVAGKRVDKVEIALEIEADGEHGILYLVTNNSKEKILRFKNELSTSITVGKSDFCSNIEYFIE